jgi:hypothetical protein
MKYAFGMGSGVMLYIRSVIKIGFGIQELMGRIYRHRDSKLIS